MLRVSRSAVLVSLLVVGQAGRGAGAAAQQSDVRARYERAAAIQAAQHDRWLLNQRITPRWIDDQRFWYQRQARPGHRYTLVDAAARRQSDLFDHAALAKSLDDALPDSVKVDAAELTLSSLRLSGDALVATFFAYGKDWRYHIAEQRLEAGPKAPEAGLVVAPDGKRGIFLKGHDLWLRDLASGMESAVTTDGQPFYAYGVSPAANGSPTTRPHVIWSPDSRKVLTAQVDDRQVREMPVINFVPSDGSVRPTAWSVRAALPGDPHATEFRMVAIDVATGKQVAAHYPRLSATRMNDTPMNGNRVWWSADSRLGYFVEIERGERRVNVVELDATTGSTRVVFSEEAETYIDLGPSVYGATSIVPLPESNQLVWYSERSGWAHLYLYDMSNGMLVRPLTQGEWLVRDVIGVDRKRRELHVTLAEKTPGKDPYYREVARVGIDDASMTIISQSDADHTVQRQPDYGLQVQMAMGDGSGTASGLSPSGDYFVEAVQRADRVTRTVLRDRTGKEILTIEPGDASGTPKWWRWPEPVQLVAADGKTIISGMVFRPSDFSPDRKYPVVDYIYGGPQVSNVPESFAEGSFTISATIAEAGFVVVVIDGRGTAERSKAFHHASYGALHTASNVEDHIAGIQQLARRFPYMDTTRVGIYGFSGGGYMTANAMLRFPEFFDVGVSGSGNHDQRLFWHTWGERYQGLLDGDNYLNQANLSYVENFKGKMLFIHGMVDHGVHPGGLFQLTQALMNANKDFDLVLMPQAGHELPGYALRRMLDYFVVHLAGESPPANFQMKTGGELAAERNAANR
jgi:dipeptidyl aminopeptidase/acylaminoacyl peptidase